MIKIKIFDLYILGATFIIALICGACSENEYIVDNEYSEKLCFDISISNKWNKETKTRNIYEDGNREVFKFDNSDMWIIATGKEGIEDTFFFGAEKESRGKEVKQNNFYDSFGLYAYVFKGDSWDNGKNEAISYIEKEKVINRGSGFWTTENTKHWPGKQYKMKFFAYAPYDIPLIVNDGNSLVIDYVIPESVNEQKDILVAQQEVQGDCNSKVELQFRHALTAVKVKAKNGIAGKIKRVEFRNIKTHGIFELGGDSWISDSKGNLVKEFEEGKELVFDENGEASIIDGDDTFMMIPQTMEEDSELLLTMEEGAQETILIAKLKGKTDWLTGHSIVYKISKTDFEYTFDVVTNKSPQEIFPASQGLSIRLKVTSFKKTSSRTEKISVGWKITEYCDKLTTDGGYIWKKDWKDVKYGKKVGINAQWIEVPQDAVTETNPVMNLLVRSVQKPWDKEELRLMDPNKNWVEHNIPSVGTIGKPFDLSKYDFTLFPSDNELPHDKSSIETANCYVVRNPGVYKFPLIYGNSIKDGKKNEIAYKNMKGHDGKAITSPIVKNAKKVKLLWQDCKGLITSVRLLDIKEMIDGEEVQYVEFTTAEQDKIKQGNALIAVLDENDTVLWSWHIWITNNEEVGQFSEMEKIDGRKYKVSHLNVGYCNDKKEFWPEREVYFKVVQDESGIERIFKIGQLSLERTEADNYTFFQYGRKDPIMGFTANRTDVVKYTDKPCFDIDGNKVDFKKEEFEASKDVDYAHKNPDKFLTGKWIDIGCKYWQENIKKIYDPSPRGMRIAPKDAFTGTTYNGKVVRYDGEPSWSETSEKMINTKINTASKNVAQLRNEEHGWWFYCAKMPGEGLWNESENKLFFPLFFVRKSETGDLMTHFTYYFTTGNSMMKLETTAVDPMDKGFQSGGGTIRPVKDENE